MGSGGRGVVDMKGESKYQPLLEYLRRSDRPQVTLTFAEIEALMQEALPDSAHSKRAWWSNRRKGALQAAAWMNAGYLVTEVDFAQTQVTFAKPPDVYRAHMVDGTVQWNGELVKALRQHMGLTQSEFAKQLGVRQQTVSEWEKGIYAPTRASSNYLTLVAEKAAFEYETD